MGTNDGRKGNAQPHEVLLGGFSSAKVVPGNQTKGEQKQSNRFGAGEGSERIHDRRTLVTEVVLLADKQKRGNGQKCAKKHRLETSHRIDGQRPTSGEQRGRYERQYARFREKVPDEKKRNDDRCVPGKTRHRPGKLHRIQFVRYGERDGHEQRPQEVRIPLYAFAHVPHEAFAFGQMASVSK